MNKLGLAPRNLILASASIIRSQILAAAGIPHDICPAGVDERAIELTVLDPSGIALTLARAKALEVSAREPGTLVLGADQTLSLGGELLHKVSDLSAAREQLMAMRGRTHQLHAAIVMAKDCEILFESVDMASLTMRKFSDDFLDAYLAAAGDAILTSVGCYHIEGLGVQLFERIEGDQFAIMGMPLLPLLHYLRTANFIVS